MKGSLWLETAPASPGFAPLDVDVTADVCVVGAGIVGADRGTSASGGRRPVSC